MTAVDRLDLEVRAGELFALLGVNGAGKTTTIKMLTCLTKPTSGEAEIFGCSIAEKAAEVKGMIGVSPQETAVAPNLTVKENLELMCGVYGFSGKKEAKNGGACRAVWPFADSREKGRQALRRVAEALKYRHGPDRGAENLVSRRAHSGVGRACQK